MSANRCPHCNVVLTQDEVKSGRCSVCKKSLDTAFAESRGSSAPARDFDQPMLTPPPPPRRSGGGRVISVLALLVALLALAVAVLRDPLGPVYQVRNPFDKGLSAYDFSTPSGAFKSRLRMDYNKDIRAFAELSRRIENKELKEEIDTLDIKKESDLKLPEKRDKKAGKTRDIRVLFVTFKREGEEVNRVHAMEKHTDSGLWKPAYDVSAFNVEETDKALAKEMREWEDKARKKMEEIKKEDIKRDNR